MTKIKKIIKNSIFILFILLPIIDCLRRTPLKNIDVFGFSLIEVINLIIIGYTLLLTIYSLRSKIKEFFPLIIYSIVLFIYIILHCKHIVNFDINIYPKANINIITEAYYILRVYYMPILLLFILIKNKDIFDMKFYSKLIKILICIISLSIVILNIFKLSYGTYSATNDEFVKYNIFDFYKSKESFKLLSTRGLFDSGNEISAILMILFPLNIYLLFKENKKFNIFLYVIQFISMIILGTRVSSLGAILITICAIIINFLAKLFNKTKINRKLIIYGIICSLYFFVSPVGMYLMDYEMPNYNVEDEINTDLKDLENNEGLADYIKNHLYELRINEAFVELYPIENDLPFWYQISINDRNKNNDSRILKTMIINRIKTRNNNPNDSLFGMGYTLNFMDLERDYVYQYYIFGILGLIMIIPQLIILINSGIRILEKIKNINLIDTLLIAMAPTLGFAVAYYSGHVFGWVSPSYILVLVLAILNCSLIVYKKGSVKRGKNKRNRSRV